MWGARISESTEKKCVFLFLTNTQYTLLTIFNLFLWDADVIMDRVELVETEMTNSSLVSLIQKTSRDERFF